MTDYEVEILQRLYTNVIVDIPDAEYLHLHTLGLIDEYGITAAGVTVLKVLQGYLQVDYSILEAPETANLIQLNTYYKWGLIDNFYLTPAGRLVLEGEL